jgi:nitroreductase
VAVVSSPNSVERIPLVEQHLSAGAVCGALLNAAHAEGWGANWLTGWMSYDKNFLQNVLTLSDSEFVAGFIHIGTKTVEPKERERPDIKNITSWLKA